MNNEQPVRVFEPGHVTQLGAHLEAHAVVHDGGEVATSWGIYSRRDLLHVGDVWYSLHGKQYSFQATRVLLSGDDLLNIAAFLDALGFLCHGTRPTRYAKDGDTGAQPDGQSI